MNQIATVIRMIGTDTAEVSVIRQSACAHDCAECSGCGSKPTSITVRAQCDIPVAPGDKVELFSDNRVLGYAALVYLAPIVLFLIGYLAVPVTSEMIRGLCGGAGFGLGIALAVLCDRVVRRRNAITYRVIRKI